MKVVPHDRVVEETIDIARRIAVHPLAALVESKKVVLAGRIDAIRAARAREDAAFARMIGGGANARGARCLLG